MNSVYCLSRTGLPFSYRMREKNSVGSDEDEYDTKVGTNCSLSAPGAFSLLNPDALSNRLESALEFIKFSVTVNPTETVPGTLEYFDTIIN